MNEFEDSLHLRIEQAENAVRLAVAEQDEYAEEMHRADLANLRRLATIHGVPLGEPGEG